MNERERNNREKEWRGRNSRQLATREERVSKYGELFPGMSVRFRTDNNNDDEYERARNRARMVYGSPDADEAHPGALSGRSIANKKSMKNNPYYRIPRLCDPSSGIARYENRGFAQKHKTGINQIRTSLKLFENLV